jgi:hypothetical protein
VKINVNLHVMGCLTVCCLQEVVQQMDPSEMQATVTKVGWQLGTCCTGYATQTHGSCSRVLIVLRPVCLL